MLVTAEAAQAQRIDSKAGESNYPLQAGVEISRAEPRPIPLYSLIDPGVKANRFLGAQRWIAKANGTQPRKCSLAKSFKQRRRAKPIADMSAHLRPRRAKEVRDRSVAGKRISRSHGAEKTGPVG